MSDGVFHLMRLWAPTDVTDDELEYQGNFSGDLRESEGSKVVAVDWSERGGVWVTLKIQGRGHISS